MKYVITGSLGNISKPITSQLIQAGHEVKVISSNEQRSADITALGAIPLIGSVEDTQFLKQAFEGADAVYTMIPPTFTASDWKKHIATIGQNYAAALKGSTVKHVVNLSSIGAHLPSGAGPVSGLHQVEKALNALEGINVLHLRPGYFYSNFYAQIGMIRNMGIVGGNYGEGTKLIIADTDDIAAVAADALLNRNFSGKSVKYIASDERTTDETASILGEAIGKPDLKWVPFSDDDNLQGMIQAGLPPEIAKNYTEMGSAMRNGIMWEDYRKTKQSPVGKTSFKDFANQFARAFKAQVVA